MNILRIDKPAMILSCLTCHKKVAHTLGKGKMLSSFLVEPDCSFAWEHSYTLALGLSRTLALEFWCSFAWLLWCMTAWELACILP